MIDFASFAAVAGDDLICLECHKTYAVVLDSGSLSPLCFRCAWVAALGSCKEAQHLALGYVVGYVLSDRFVTPRNGGRK